MGLRDNYLAEMQSAWLYQHLAKLEHGQRRQLFQTLAVAAQRQAGVWAKEMETRGESPASFHPDWRARLAAWLLSRFGPRPLLPVLAALKVRGLSAYSKMPSTGALAGHVSERQHAAAGSSGSLRAGLFGALDGLISNASLMAGVAGAALGTRQILLTGFAGMLAGAFAMAAGEYVSMRAQREFHERQIGLEHAELEAYPAEEAEELALIYQARGLDKAEAARLASALIADPEQGLATLAREELGLNPDELGSPWAAAVASFFTFAGGALLPLLPFLLVPPAWRIAGTVAITWLALWGVGALSTLFTGRSALYSGLRFAGVGTVAGLATYGIGHLFGVALG